MEPASLASRADSLLTVDDGNTGSNQACGGDHNTSTSENQPTPRVRVDKSTQPEQTRQPPKDSVKESKWRRWCQNCKKHVPQESWLNDWTTHTGCVEILVEECPQDEIDASTTEEQKAKPPAKTHRKTSSTQSPPKKLKRAGGPLHSPKQRVRAPMKMSGLYSFEKLKIPDYIETKRNQDGRVSMYICNHHDHGGKGREIPPVAVRLVHHLRTHKDAMIPCDFCQIPGLSNEPSIIRHQLDCHPVQLFQEFKAKGCTVKDFKTLVTDVMEEFYKSSLSLESKKKGFNYQCKFCTGPGAGLPRIKYNFTCHLLRHHKSVIGHRLIELQSVFGFGSTMIT